jgi:hypothetical protein
MRYTVQTQSEDATVLAAADAINALLTERNEGIFDADDLHGKRVADRAIIYKLLDLPIAIRDQLQITAVA